MPSSPSPTRDGPARALDAAEPPRAASLKQVSAEVPPEPAEARQDGLDVLRALAILPVLFFHSPEQTVQALPAFLRDAFRFGWMGVDLFFVLSGYLIGRQVFSTRAEAPLGTQLRHFWVKRWTRTLPLYFLVLGTYAFLKPWLFGAPFVGGGWHYALFLQNYRPLQDFVQSWSLCVEEHFYLVLPLLAFGLRGRKWPAWVWLVPAGASLLGRVLVSRTLPADMPVLELIPVLQWPTHLHLDGLAVGVFLARTAPSWRAWAVGRKVASAVAGLGVLGVTVALCGPLLVGAAKLWVFTGLTVGFGLVLMGMESLRLPSGLRRAVYALAVTSYGAYLWHGLVVRLFERSHFTLGGWGLDLLAFVGVTLLVSAVTYRLVEKPGLRLRRWLLGVQGHVAAQKTH
jgi:peptidoglycan/LPS O-acetylase OafA/YrhL